MQFGWGTFVRIIVRLKSKIYGSVIHSVAFNGSEYWPTTKGNECCVAVIETKMLLWVNGLTCCDHIRNEVWCCAPRGKISKKGVFDSMIMVIRAD